VKKGSSILGFSISLSMCPFYNTVSQKKLCQRSIDRRLVHSLYLFSHSHHNLFIFCCVLYKMLLHLFSDANYNLLGFNATYTFSVCPGDCGGHGRCDSATARCQCHQGWGGMDCSTPLCSQVCTQHDHGHCDKVGKK